VSNPDFPGPSWQDRPGFPESRGGQGYRDQGRSYAQGRGYEGRPGSGGSGAGNGRDPYARDPYARNGRDRAGYGQDRGGAGGTRGRGDYDGVGSHRAGSRVGAGRARGRDRYGTAGYDRLRSGLGANPDGYGASQYGYGPDGYGPGQDGDGPWRDRLGRGVDTITGRVRAFRDRRGTRQYTPRQRPPGNWAQRQWRASWWRRWTLKKAALVAGGLVACMILTVVGGFFYAYSTVALPLAALTKPPIQSSVVYFSGRNGQQVGCFCIQNRRNLDWAHISKDPYLKDAFFAAEDRNFMTEPGISFTGTVRALLVDLTGGGTQGGSTITEQFIKSYLDPAGVGLTPKEKIKEIILAIKLNSKESKEWILTSYLNVINLGNGAYGVEAAAETYWGIHAWQVSPAQAAMLAAMVQEPSGFNPQHPSQNVSGLNYSLLDRWIYVLGNMVRDGAISQQQFNALVPVPSPTTQAGIQEDLKHFPTVHIKGLTWTGYRGYIMTIVQAELSAYYGINQTMLNQNGYQIHTTINLHLMNELYAAIHQDKVLMRQYAAQQGGKIGFQPWMRLGAVLEQPGTGAIRAFYAGPGFGVKHCNQVSCQQNMILDSQQVGSSFKPYVLTTAISQGMNAKTSILNSHDIMCIPPADWPGLQPGQQGYIYQHMKSKWSLANCNTHIGFYKLNQPGEINHPLAVPYATAYSSNPAFEDLIHRTGVFPVLNMAAKLGVSPGSVHYLKSLFGPGAPQAGSVQTALGQGPLTPVDQANTFATLVSNGVTALPHIISSVTQNGTTVGRPAIYKPKHELGPYVAADADYALSFDTVLGGATGTNANIGRPTVAKTGTLGQAQNASEAWFIGAIPQYSFSVALFTNRPAHQYLDNLPTVGGWTGGYGGDWPATIWHTYMSKITGNLPVEQLPVPNFNPPRFTKWNQAPQQPKCKNNQQGGGGQGGGGNGNGNGNGHHHHGPFWQFAQFKPKPKGGCQKNGGRGGPGPGPSPTPSPSSSPSPTPSPSPSPSPSPGPTKGHPIAPATAPGSGTSPAHAPKPAKDPAAGSPATTAAVLPRPVALRSAWSVWITGLA
jgi:membrane peptidoglycan carboxypeptidase